jgi:hypothetical protein
LLPAILSTLSARKEKFVMAEKSKPKLVELKALDH